jgi:hypothetical protein
MSTQRFAVLWVLVFPACSSAGQPSSTSSPRVPNDSGGTVVEHNDATTPSPSEVGPVATRVTCQVIFAVNGINWEQPEGGIAADASSHAVYLVGDAPILGAFIPASGVSLTESASDTWTGSVPLLDQLRIEFKFVKIVSGVAPEWEGFGPYDSNRSLIVDCSSDGAAPAANPNPTGNEAGSDGGTVVGVPATGKTYFGTFNVRPADATK